MPVRVFRDTGYWPITDIGIFVFLILGGLHIICNFWDM